MAPTSFTYVATGSAAVAAQARRRRRASRTHAGGVSDDPSQGHVIVRGGTYCR